YILWYWIQPRCSLVVSAVVQLAIPPVTACMGVLFLAEDVTLRLVVASVLILGGICLAVWPAKPCPACAGKHPQTGEGVHAGRHGR
ncbi:MAG: EamA family transporter, partial [Desulfovibrio sp.]|nr:EamA family transporter [Desulfovibrio sp.]